VDITGRGEIRGNEETVAAPVGGQLILDKRDVNRAWHGGSRKTQRLMRVAKGSGRHSSLQGKARRIFNQITTRTISAPRANCLG
jgi:hypothetical protein